MILTLCICVFNCSCVKRHHCWLKIDLKNQDVFISIQRKSFFNNKYLLQALLVFLGDSRQNSEIFLCLRASVTMVICDISKVNLARKPSWKSNRSCDWLISSKECGSGVNFQNIAAKEITKWCKKKWNMKWHGFISEKNENILAIATLIFCKQGGNLYATAKMVGWAKRDENVETNDSIILAEFLG